MTKIRTILVGMASAFLLLVILHFTARPGRGFSGVCNGGVISVSGGGSSGGGTVIVANVTGNPAVDVVNTAAETDLLSTAIAAGTMGTGGQLRIALNGTLLSSTGGPITTTVRIKLGATTLITMGITNGSAANANPFSLLITIMNAGVANAQYATARYIQGQGATSGAASNVLLGIYQIGTNSTATVDTTVSQTLAVSAQWSSASPNADLKMYGATVERFPT